VIQEINCMCSSAKPYSDFVVTKAVGDSGGLQAEEFYNEKGQLKAKVGDYTVPLLSGNKSERDEQLAKKGAVNEEDYYLMCLPAQVQLAERMRRRGQRVDNGTRLEYIVSRPDMHTAKQYEKLESAEYLSKHQDLVKVDYLYYLKALASPLDQVLCTAFKGMDDFVLNQYKFRLKVRQKVLQELRDIFATKIDFE
jgi:DNA polymerase elongation subunit (family B)